jgi:hypothetical protein
MNRIPLPDTANPAKASVIIDIFDEEGKPDLDIRQSTALPEIDLSGKMRLLSEDEGLKLLTHSSIRSEA